MRQRVTEKVGVPANFAGFFRDSNIKEELNHLLATAGSKIQIPKHKDLFITFSSLVINIGSSVQMEGDCNQMVDSRILFHLMNAVR